MTQISKEKLVFEGCFNGGGGQNVSAKMVEFSCNGAIQHYILDSNYFDWQIVPTLTNHWSVHEVGHQIVVFDILIF